MLDETARRAVQQVSERLGVTPSEAMRRALVSYRDEVLGPSPERVQERVQALAALRRKFRGHDGRREVKALYAERARE